MRFVSVLGAIGVGLAIGSAVILTPLTMGTSSPTATNSAASYAHWASQLGHQAIASVRSLAGASAKSDKKSAASDPSGQALGYDTASSPLAHESKTIDNLAQSGASTAKLADARNVQTPWATQVTVAPEAAAPKKLTSSKPTSDEQRQDLVRNLQAELKRVGCYDGEPNGSWGAASKKAMASFTERVNASLPFEQPDFILLTLVQGHKGRACGQDCPAGQGLADNGRCTPSSILAQAERAKNGDGKQGDGFKRETVAAAAAFAATAAVAAKANDDTKHKARVIQQNSSPTSSAWAATIDAQIETGSVAAAVPAPVRVIRPPVAALSPKAQTAPPVEIVETPARPATILPGRMAMGAPISPLVETAPAVEVKPIVANKRIAAAELTQPPQPTASEPVTAAIPVESAPRAKRAVRHQPTAIIRAPAYRAHVQAAPQVKRAPEPVVVVRRPPPAPRYYAPRYAGNTYGTDTSGSKSRRMVYEMFQRPDRN